jgi:dipeptidyl aminopeptidase/acylaminoacyl peptidase
MKVLTATAAAVLAFVTTLPAAQVVRRFTLDDFSRVKRVADPQFAPDGASVAVVISAANLDENRYVASLERIEIASGKSQVLVNGDKAIAVSFPRWSPDGQHIAYLATVATSGQPKPQVFVVSSHGGDAKQITTAPGGVQQLVWSPDSKTIGFATADEPEKKPGSQRWNDSFEVQLNDHLFTAAELPPTHVWTVPASGGTMKRLTSGTWTLPVTRPPGAPSSMITWTPDGAGILFNRSGTGGGLQIVNVADGTIKPLGGGNGTHPVYSPNKDMVAFLLGPNAAVLPIRAAPGGQVQPRQLTQSIDRGIARALWMPDGKSLIVGANDDERVSLWQVPLDGSAKKLDTGDVSPNSSFFVDMAVSSTGAIAFSGSSPTRPSELYYKASLDAPLRRLTIANDEIASIPLGKSDVVKFTNDSFEQNAVLTYPPDFDPAKKYPMVLLIHGGPRAASMMTFSSGAQLMAAKGWLVLQPNYRGSDNLGRKFQGAITGDAGAGPGRDVMAAVQVVKAKGFVDETRLGVSGWSYGGYMTTWMLGNYPDVWKVGVAGAAVTDRIDQQSFSDGATGTRGTTSPWLNADAMERERAQSPMTYAGKIKAPTLILANTGDYRVPITQSYKLFHALRDAGVTARFIAYPISGHNATDPVRQRDVQERWIGWLERYLNDAPTPGGR